jgi:hypothetical protein
MKLVSEAAAWETTRGTGSCSAFKSLGNTSFEYDFWKFYCISSEICPKAWQQAYLNIGFGSAIILHKIATIGWIFWTSSIY